MHDLSKQLVTELERNSDARKATITQPSLANNMVSPLKTTPIAESAARGVEGASEGLWRCLVAKPPRSHHNVVMHLLGKVLLVTFPL